GVKALKHFQDAFKLNPSLLDALSEARSIYWQLGKLNMVQKLLELELKNASGPRSSPLWRELGDVYCDMADYDRAVEAYARALQAADGKAGELSEMLQDVQVAADEWQDRIGQILRSAHQSSDRQGKVTAFLRAARLARRYAPDEVEGLLM